MSKKNQTMDKILSFRCEDEFKKQVKKAADKQKRTESQWLKLVVEKAIKTPAFLVDL